MGRVLSRWWPVILLLIIFGAALYLRVVPIYDSIFVGDNVKFASNDAYYFLRQVDNITQHYPSLSSFDPYLNYPSGIQLGGMNFFIYFLGGITWLLGLGSPSAHMLDIVSAFLPAILAALTVIPVYFIGKTLFNRGAGIIAAALFAILPGDLLGRTLLGVTDRDSLEILLTTLTMLFLILAVKNARKKQLTFRGLSRQNLAVYTKPIIYSLLAGILLGLSILTWRGSFLFAGIFLVYFIVQSILDYSEDESFSYLSFVGSVTFLVALLIVAIVSRSQIYSAALAISFLIPVVFSGLEWLLRRWNANSFFYFLSIVIIGLAGVGILYAASPSLFRSIIDQFSVFVPSQAELTIAEVGPILFPAGNFTLDIVWGNFTTCIYISLIALIVLIFLAFKRNRSDEIFLIVWAFILFLGTIDLRRLAPFYAVPVSLLTGYLAVIFYYSVQIAINYITRRSNREVTSQLQMFINQKQPVAVKPVVEPSAEIDYYTILGVPQDASRKQIKKAHARLVFKYSSSGALSDEDKEKLKQIERAYSMLSDEQRRAAYNQTDFHASIQKKDKTGTSKSGFRIANVIKAVIIGIIIFFVVFFPNFGPISATINQAKTYAPSDAWCDSLVWLRDNSPEPFGDSSSYYNLYHTSFDYPETVYCTTAWWDYGYWILRIGHRIPNCDPGAGARELVARLFLSRDASEAYKLANNLDSKYIIVDDSTVTEFFYAVAAYAGTTVSQYSEPYYIMSEGKLTPVRCYYPEYYQSLAVRLYNYDGEEVTPTLLLVICYTEKTSSDGIPYKEITSSKYFTSYQEAVDYVAQQTTGNYRIVSTDPLISPIPLERLEQYKLVYSSSQNSTIYPSQEMPTVKIFEYVD